MTPLQCTVILAMHAQAQGGPKADPLGASYHRRTTDSPLDLFALAAMPTM